MCECRCCQIIGAYTLNCLSIITLCIAFLQVFFIYCGPFKSDNSKTCLQLFSYISAVPSEMVDRGYFVWCGWNTVAKSVNCNASGIEVCRLCRDTGKILLNKQYLADNGWRFHIPGSSHVVSESG